MLVTKTCGNCEQEFSRTISKDRVERTKFCSRKCLGEWIAKQRGWDGVPWTEKSREYQKKWHQDNSDKVKKYREKWAMENPDWFDTHKQTEAYKESRRGIRYKNRYGITLEQYKEMYKNQKGLCAICNNPPPLGERLYVDHNHKTGKVRELVCRPHNSGISFFNDDPELLRRAANYVEKHSKEDD